MSNFETEGNGENAKEKEKSDFERAHERVQERLLVELRENFSELEYHNPDHSIGVGNQAAEFLKVLGESEGNKKDMVIAKTIGYGHDKDQTYTLQPAFSGIGMRRARETGAIEKRSADDVIALLEEEGLELDERDKRVIREAIEDGTTPGYDPELKTVIQPGLNKDSHFVTWSVAAADLGASGFDPDHFLKDGDAVFNEDRFLPPLDTLDEETLKKLYKEVIDWTSNQVDYAKGQKAYWDRDIVPAFIKEQLTKFDDSIQLCEERRERRKALYDENKTTKENLEILLQDMGYNRFLPKENVEQA